MSRQIDLTQELSEDDRQYLVDRADHVSLERNAALVAGSKFVAGHEAEGLPNETLRRIDPGAGDQQKAIEDMTKPELQEELRKLELPVSGNVDELLARLVEARTQQS